MTVPLPAPVGTVRGAAPTVTRLLRDASNRTMLQRLRAQGDAPIDVATLQSESMPHVPARYVRDRLRAFADLGLVERTHTRGAAPGNAWLLSASGTDLHRVQAIVTHIVARAARHSRSPAQDESIAIDQAFDALADPVVLTILGAMARAGAPMDPASLEVACEPIPRRTLYRRLRTLQDAGLMRRLVTREVPRRTHYELTPGWRPIAGVLLLAAWWELRHAPSTADPLDLTTLVLIVAPVARPAAPASGEVQWQISSTSANTQHLTLTLDADGVTARPGPAEVETTVGGDALAWATAMVTDDRSGLTLTGELPLANESLTATRAALLAGIR